MGVIGRVRLTLAFEFVQRFKVQPFDEFRIEHVELLNL